MLSRSGLSFYNRRTPGRHNNMKTRSLPAVFVCCLLLSVFASGNSIVFVTSTTTPGSFGGVAGGNSICSNRAAAGGLTGTYKAWLSDGNGSPSSRFILSDQPYQLLDGTIIANNWADLVDGTLAAPISLNELGVAVPDTEVWTGTFANGGSGGLGGSCQAWSSSGVTGTFGRSSSTTATWTAFNSSSCIGSRHLYCFQQVQNLYRFSGRILSTAGRPITHAKVVVTASSLPNPATYFTDRR